MDYEKKYNEALERAKNLMEQVRNNELLGFPDQFTEIFPELREDEDERVRKVIVKYFKGLHEQSWINLEIPDILAYLEKQKEQKPAWSEEDEILRVRTINRLETLNFHGISGKEIRESIDWLKSLRPSWKPSDQDELMKLKYAGTSTKLD